MIRIEVPDRATAEQLLTGLYIAAGVLPAPTVPDEAMLRLANRLADQLEKLPPAPEAPDA